MNNIDIQITKAQLKDYTVTMSDGLPQISARIALFTANDKEISTFSISTENYYQTTRFDIPIEMMQPITDIAKRLENITTAICNRELALLPVPESQE